MLIELNYSCERNYCLKNEYIFTSLRERFVADDCWKRLPSSEHSMYLPPTKKSISVKRVLTPKTLPDLQGQEHEDWKEFDLFEVESCGYYYYY